MIAGRTGQLLLLILAMALGGYVRTAVSPLQEAMRMSLSLTDNEMALLQGPVIGIPVVLAAVPLGFLIDRWQRVRLVKAIIALAVLGSFLTAVASSFSILMCARALAGVMGTSVLPVVFSLVADLYPPKQRGRANSLIVVGQVVGNSTAFALGGALLALEGSASDSWRLAMTFLSVPLVPLALVLLGLREPPRTQVALAHPSTRQVVHALGDYRAMVVPLVIGIVAMETAVGAMLVWGAPMLARNFALLPDRIGAIMALVMLASGILGPLVGGTLADVAQRAGGPRGTVLFLFAAALLSVLGSVFGFVPGSFAASLLLGAVMTLMLATAVMGMTLVTIVIPNELRGLCMSLLLAIILLFALAVAPVTVSALSGAMGGLTMIGPALSVVCMTCGGIAAAIFLGARATFPETVIS